MPIIYNVHIKTAMVIAENNVEAGIKTISLIVLRMKLVCHDIAGTINENSNLLDCGTC